MLFRSALNREMRLTLALGRIFTYIPRIPGKFSLYALNTASAGDDPDLDDASKHPVLNVVYKILIVVLIIQIILLVWFKFFLR